MYDSMFGNPTATKVLTFIAVNRDAYAQEIVNQTGIALSLVQKQLRRLERGNILVSRPRGRMRFYEFNPRLPLVDIWSSALRQSIDYLPADDREMYLMRGRPRAQGKRL